jgi:hypothetical protein
MQLCALAWDHAGRRLLIVGHETPNVLVLNGILCTFAACHAENHASMPPSGQHLNCDTAFGPTRARIATASVRALTIFFGNKKNLTQSAAIYQENARISTSVCLEGFKIDRLRLRATCRTGSAFEFVAQASGGFRLHA